MDKDSKILIVGHGDVIEKSLVEHLRANQYSAVFSSSESALETTIQPSVYDFFQKVRPEFVFLTSTRSGGIEANQKFPAEFIYHNIESQNNIVYASHKFGAKKLLYFGASCVYPKDCAQPMKEESLLTGPFEKTSEAYSVAKLAGIKLCESYRRQHGFNAIVAVPATIYGPESDTDLEKAHVMGALIAKFVKAVKNNEKEVTVWGSGNPRREFLFRDDFVSAALYLMERYDDEKMINLGFGSDVAIKELAQIIAEIVQFKGKIVFDSSKPDGAMVKLLDSSRLQNLGWKPKVGLKEGIAKTIEWYKKL